MKRKFTRLTAALALLAFLAVPLGMRADEASYVFNTDAGIAALGIAKPSAGSGTDLSTTEPYTVGQISMSVTHGGTNTRVWNSNGTLDLRIYKNGGSLTFTAASGYNITGITIEGTTVNIFNANAGTYSNGSWSSTTGVESVTLSATGTGKINTITVTYTDGGSTLEDNDLELGAETLALDLHNNPNTGTVSYTTSSTGAVTVTGGTGYVTTEVDETNKIITVTPVAVTPSAQTITVSQAPDATYAGGSATFTVTVANTTPTVNVTYHANGGVGENVVETPYQGSDYTVAANTFSYTNHSFTKWHTTEAGTGGTDYNPGDPINNIQNDIDLYAQWEEVNEVVDVLNKAFTGVGNNFSAWENKTGTSGAVYAGRSGGQNNSIQLNATSPSGIVSTGSGGNVKKVVINWNSNTSDGKTLNIYGKNTAYTGSAQLYDNNDQGDLLGTIVKGTNTELNISGSYSYIGIKATGTSFYLNEIQITWATSGTPAPSYEISNNDEIAYDATSGSFNFTVQNAVDGGVTTVAEEVEWISSAAVSGNSVTFNTTQNDAAANRSGVITLTYTYNTNETVTKDVTIVQLGNPDYTPTIAEVRAQGTGSVVTKGIVTSCVGTTGYIQDATAAICVYGSTLTVGDEIRVSGTLTTYNGLLEITSPQVTVLSSGNTVEPIVKTIAEINTDYAGSNALQGMLVKIENATVTAISGQNTTIAQGESTIVVRGISSSVTYEVNSVFTELTGNIGAYNAAQIVNPTDIIVQQSTEPSIYIESDAFEITAAGEDGYLEIAYANLTITQASDFAVQFYDANNQELNGDAAPTWIQAEVTTQTGEEGYFVYYVIGENTDTEARIAYFKVFAMDGSEFVYSNLVTVTQSGYEVDYATLPFNWAGGTKEDLTALAGVSGYGLGSNYAESNAPYRVKFDTDGDYILIKTDQQPGEVTVGIKKLGGANASSITISGSSDGLTFTPIQEFDNDGTTNTVLEHTTTVAFNANDRYVRIYFNKPSNGSNVGVGPITIAQVDNTPSITLSTYEVNVDAAEHDGTLGLAYANLTISDMDDFAIQYYDAQGEEVDEPVWIEVLVAEQEPTIGEGYEVSYYMIENEGDARTAYFKVWALDDENNAVYSNLVTVSQAAPVPTYVVSFALDGGTFVPNAVFTDDNVEVEAGTYALPSATKTGSSFAGWRLDGTDDIYAGGQDYEVNDDASFTAQWNQGGTATINFTTGTGNTPINGASVTGNDSEGNTWTITTVGTTSFTPGNTNSQVGSSSKPATSITFTTTLPQYSIITAFSAKFGGNSGSHGDVNLMVDETTVGTGTITASSTVIVENNKTASGTTLTVTVTNISKGILCYYISYTYSTSTETYTDALVIDGYSGGDKDGYRLIAMPVAVDPANVAGMTTGDFDLYYFDQTMQGEEWRNYEDSQTGGFNLIPGKGYLYANTQDVTLSLEGVPYSGDGVINLTYDENVTYAGWNLIGNPFGNAATIDKPYYRLNNDGNALGAEIEGENVAAMEGVFVKATEAGQTATFTAQTRGGKQTIAYANIQILGEQGNVIDNAIVRFDNGETLGKFQLKENSTKIYFTEDHQDYAIVRSNAEGEMPVSFKAENNGTYTFSVNAENVEMNYLHLIDNLTGADIDLLATPSYSFEAKTTDYASRFKLVFAANEEDGPSTSSGTFAFYNGSEWVISNMGEATLQVVDMMGRVLSTETVSGNATMNTNSLSAGIYMMRLINGNDVKVQKIVVR